MLNPSIPTRLEEMVNKKRGRLSGLSSFDTLNRGCADRAQSFVSSLNAENKSLILEFKPASPSKGVINQSATVEDFVKIYQPFASCISVLVDDVYFGGSYHNLAKARRITSLPLLAKDITFEPAQIMAAKAHGADVILLMLSVLSDALYQQLYDLAKSLGLAVISEVANQQECLRLQGLPVECIGINHRNFADLTIDLNKTQQLIAEVPAGVPVIAESGLGQFDDFLKVHPQVSGYLIGSSLMASPQPKTQLRKLLYSDIKVCGVTQADQALELVKVGAQRIGVIRTSQSPRFNDCATQIAEIRQATSELVGVYLDQSIEQIVDEVHRFGFTCVQLHGCEPLAFIESLQHQLADTATICKVLDGASASIEDINILLNAGLEVLLDCKTAEQQGGTGLVFDWARIPQHLRAQVRLAGGVSTDNIQHALALGYRQFDVNSRIEKAPGIKDLLAFQQLLKKIEQFRGNSHVYG